MPEPDLLRRIHESLPSVEDPENAGEEVWRAVYYIGMNIAWMCEEEWSHGLSRTDLAPHVRDAYERAVFSVANNGRPRRRTSPQYLPIGDERAEFLRGQLAPKLERHRRGHAPGSCRWCGGSPAEPAIAVCRNEPTRWDPAPTNIIEVLRYDGDDVVVRVAHPLGPATVATRLRKHMVDYREVAVGRGSR
ncbi:hypothetical protein [Amycolatopsis sp. NPDC004079]|uniref:hypothetical protein n=1 Tax=Amycolatopsis sp. NPDC004079 TaxID=3154549 RepID=UPI0033A16017